MATDDPAVLRGALTVAAWQGGTINGCGVLVALTRAVYFDDQCHAALTRRCEPHSRISGTPG